MNLIKVLPEDDPSKITGIVLDKSIVICSTTNIDNVVFDEKSIFLTNPKTISFSSQKTLSNNFTVVNYVPNIRWSIPKDINLTFKEPSNFRNKSYFGNLYFNNNYQVKLDKNTLIGYYFTIFVDRARSQEVGNIPKGEHLIEVGIEYKPFAENAIENIYYIRNDYCFQEFEEHFSK